MKWMAASAGAGVLLLAGCASAPPVSPASETAPPAASPAGEASPRLGQLADRFVALQMNYNPVSAYFTGLPAPDHRRWPDRSPEAIAAYEAEEDAILGELSRLDTREFSGRDARITYALLREQLESSRQGRICRGDLWDVNHMGGWHLGIVQVAQKQPVGTADERAQALERWRSLPRLVDQEIANLRRGLDQGYSAPKSVARRVMKQLDGLAAAPLDKSPLLNPAERAADETFKAAWRETLAGQVNPALTRYRDFLDREYLPRAREALGVSANPNGGACYRAGLRNFTTLDRPPEEVYELGRRTVEANATAVVDMGARKFGTRDLPTILKRLNEAPDNQFKSEQELIDFSREVVARAREKSAPLFHTMPEQEVRVEPFREFKRGTGGSSHYEPEVDPKQPAYYRINSEMWEKETRGGAEIVGVHEAYPGHHMQLAFARTLPQSPLAKLSFNSAYVEGWARYSERLAEEAGMYGTDYALMSRRIWPARGMVADPGMHVLGWSRRQTIDYLVATGRFSLQESEDLVDRMAVWPGQLTAYDSGGLEIMALRAEAEKELGPRFDIRDFHRAVLELGVVPLGALREHVRSWIAAEKAQAR